MSSQAQKEKARKELVKKKKDNGEVDYSLISFNFIFEPEYFVDPLDLTFRYQTFRELRDWGQIISPSSNIHPGDRTEKLLELLKNCLISPSGDKFESWIDQLYEPDVERFIKEYGGAKSQRQKK